MNSPIYICLHIADCKHRNSTKALTPWILQASRDLQLPRAMLKAMPTAVERRFLSQGIPITEHVVNSEMGRCPDCQRRCLLTRLWVYKYIYII